MSEKLTTDPLAYYNFLMTNSVEDRLNLKETTDLISSKAVTDTDLINAFHFMVDVELDHALWVDEVTAYPQDFSTEAYAEECRNNSKLADAINYAKSQLRIGNVALIKALSEYELNHNIEYGVMPYTPDDAWDGESKRASFQDFMILNVPDTVPKNL